MKLYNNIELPGEWPPKNMNLNCSQPMRIPYLENPPAVVNVDNYRQLFVDDFLVEQGDATSAVRNFHYPVKYPCNPIFFPQTELELKNPEVAPCAVCKCGGVQFDKKDKLFKMWYMTSYCGNLAYAQSSDGIHWERPELDVVPGTNLCLPQEYHPDSGSVIIDDECKNPEERFKMLFRAPGRLEVLGILFTSPDGIHWNKRTETGKTYDRSTLFYNPFTKKWVQSIRWTHDVAIRSRYYYEHEDFVESAKFDWKERIPVEWMRADDMDKGDRLYPQLYNFDAQQYESIMLGFFQLFKGPENNISAQDNMPKNTELIAAYSRDGFHFHRPDRNALIAPDRRQGSWEYGYVESSAGCCQVVGDELWIYYSAYGGEVTRKPKDWKDQGVYANGAVGLAKMRRDGFASMNFRFPGAKLTTRLVEFIKGSRLRVNANTVGSLLKAQVLAENNEVIPGFSRDECVGFLGNSCAGELSWKNASLAVLKSRPVRIEFSMDRGELYSFEII